MDDDFYTQPELEEEAEGAEEDVAEGAGDSAAAAAKMAAEASNEGAPVSKGKEKANSVPSEANSAGGGVARDAQSGGSVAEGIINKKPLPTPADGHGENSSEGKLKPVEKEQIKELQNILEGKKKSDVVQELATGDTLVKDGKTQHLFMPNGDRLSMNADGSYELKSKEGVKVKSEKGVTTITYANGDTVEFDREGLRGIHRGKQAVSFPRGEENNMHRELKPRPSIENGPSSSGSNELPNVIRNGGRNSSENSAPNREGSRIERSKPTESSGEGRSMAIPPASLDQLRNALRRGK